MNKISVEVVELQRIRVGVHVQALTRLHTLLLHNSRTFISFLTYPNTFINLNISKKYSKLKKYMLVQQGQQNCKRKISLKKEFILLVSIPLFHIITNYQQVIEIYHRIL